MPKQKADKPSGNIDQEIGELVSQLDEATQKLTGEIELAARPDDEFDLKATIDSAEKPKPKAEPAVATAPTLDAQVDAMLEDASASAQDAPPKDVGAIDSQLAELADEMLEGDIDDLDGALASAAAVEAMPKAAPKAESAALAEAIDEDDLLEGDFDDLNEALANAEATEKQPAPKPKAPAPAPAPAAPTPAPKAEAPAPKPAPKAEPVPKAEPAAVPAERPAAKPAEPEPEFKTVPGKRRASVLTHAAIGRAGKVALAIAEKANKPLDNKPAGVRDVAGWLAAVTLFNAAAVWVFLLIARGPAPGTSDEPAVDLVGQNATASVDAESID